MGASLNELFGDAAAVQSASDNQYGLRPTGFRLPDATHIRAVTLQVSDLARSRAFYENTLGFSPITVCAGQVAMGAAGSTTPLVTLIENRAGARRTPKHTLGLYPVATLLPTRGDLGRFLRHLELTGVRAGAGDHLVSEALYLQDPDNLGIEVYADRPRSTWSRRNAELVMATDPVDVRGLVAAAGSEPWTGMPKGTTIGHVHLHVGELDQAARFYSEAIGFDRMVWSYPSALFMAAGGYHHHLGTNTWAGPDALPAEPDAPQLLEWVLELPSVDDLNQAAASLRDNGFAVDAVDADLLTRDPWGTTLRITATPSAR
jgi:catechol 2,3-dioxygenase